MKKIHSLPDLAEIIEDLKKNHNKIVLANGCFDLIHVGHIRYLREAKELGDILVVAINSDSSVHSLKGQGRPLLSQSERTEIIASFSFVDFVTIFTDADVNNVLKSLKPDFHAKGSDYTVDTIPEKDTAIRYGGKAAITGGPKVRSTSEIIRTVAQAFQNHLNKK